MQIVRLPQRQPLTELPVDHTDQNYIRAEISTSMSGER